MKWYILRWKRTFDFSGRSRRSEYWMSFLFDIIFIVALVIVDMVLNLGTILPSIYSIVIFLPNLSCTIRRIHDIGKSGFYYLLQVPFIILSKLEDFNIIPIDRNTDSPIYMLAFFVFGALSLVIFVFTFINGEVGDNKYGKDPKELDLVDTLI
ncbi:MAG: DUF805 domain-containing protein [Clostridium sp.]